MKWKCCSKGISHWKDIICYKRELFGERSGIAGPPCCGSGDGSCYINTIIIEPSKKLELIYKKLFLFYHVAPLKMFFCFSTFHRTIEETPWGSFCSQSDECKIAPGTEILYEAQWRKSGKSHELHQITGFIENSEWLFIPWGVETVRDIFHMARVLQGIYFRFCSAIVHPILTSLQNNSP